MLFACYMSKGQAFQEGQMGLRLMYKYTCLTCHSINKKTIGPSFEDIAKRYYGSPPQYKQRLERSIINGGTGEWVGISMRNCVGNKKITPQQATIMTEWILSNKK